MANSREARFTGFIAIDEDGNNALGYSVFKRCHLFRNSIRQWVASDPLGAMGNERILRNGVGAQTGSNRWGDYSAMASDPTQGCRFWYTNQYYNRDAATAWKTTIGVFTLTPCSP